MANTSDNFEGMVSGPSFREQARQFIRGLIVTGKMRRDEIYSVPRLADELKVSATPVREALLDLASEGLLEPVRNRGFRVVGLTPQELRDIFAIRLLLEVPSAAEVARRGGTLSQLQELRGLANAMQQLADAGDVIGFLDVDRKFHLALIDTLGNRELSKIVAALRDRVRLFGLDGRTKEHLARSAGEHVELIDCVEQRDADGAAALIRNHLERSRDLWASAAPAAVVGAAERSGATDALTVPLHDRGF